MPNETPKSKSEGAYVNLSRGLNLDELSQSGTQKLILNDLTRAEEKVKELESFTLKYYELLAEKKVLDEKLAKVRRGEI